MDFASVSNISGICIPLGEVRPMEEWDKATLLAAYQIHFADKLHIEGGERMYRTDYGEFKTYTLAQIEKIEGLLKK